MTASRPLNVIFYWHMHQPFYRDANEGNYHLPWVYLHAMKEYTDMAVVLAQVKGARAVVNYVPSLTAQLDEYSQNIHAYLNGMATTMHDPLLDALVAKPPYSEEQRAFLLKSCFRLEHGNNLHRYPAYAQMWHLAEHCRDHPDSLHLSDAYFNDLMVWYHLGWLAETARETHYVARRLFEKERAFTLQDRRDLLSLIAALIAELPIRYRALHDAGVIELSTTPYAHPIIPLMLDFNTARETVPDAMIPAQSYPHAKARAVEHIELAQASHHDYFGHSAAGCWPAEGAVSDATLGLLADAGFDWCATGEGILHHSLACNVREDAPESLYQPWLSGQGERRLPCFFRDDHLSDLIGFEYKTWDTYDAVANFMHELSQIRERTQGMDAPVVSIIMDGENAWEHYYHNGIPFLTALYQAVASNADYRMTTFSDYLATCPTPKRLESLTAGSWVYGNLSTWIGDRAKTKGWELLVEAKLAYDVSLDGLDDSAQAAAAEQLRICEGSDWFWWFGDYNPSDVVQDFDRLYRQHLRKLYTLLGLRSPDSLNSTISLGSGKAEDGGAMRRGNQ